jgi:integrase
MSSVRQTKNGLWEVDVRSKLLPKRRFFTFDDESTARAWSKECDRQLKAGVVPPALLTAAVEKAPKGGLLGPLIREFLNREQHSASDDEILGRLFDELAHVKLNDLNYAWCEKWVSDLKLLANLSPGTIRKRVGALSRVLDWQLRSNPESHLANPLHLLPRGYSIYSQGDARRVEKLGGKVKTDVARDRRLTPAEEARIRHALGGGKRPDRERALALPDGPAMSMLLDIIIWTGVRLREAYMLRIEHVDLAGKTLKVQNSKERNGRKVFRSVPIRRELAPALAAWVGERRKVLGTMTGLLFGFWDEDPDSMKTVTGRLSARFASIFDYANCEALTEHDLRHEATCRWFELRNSSGHWMFRFEEVSTAMGWKPGSVMAQRYASFRAEDLAARLWAE